MRIPLFMLAGTAVLGSCSGGDSTQNPGPGTPVVAKASASGAGQTAPVATALPAPIRVIVTTDGAPQAGTLVTWTAAGGGSMNPGSLVTDANGIASSTWTLGQSAGVQAAQAAVSGASGSPVSFGATGTARAAAGIAVAGGGGQTGNTGSVLATPLQALVTDQFGNPVAGVTVIWAVTSGGGSVAPLSSITNAQGIASTSQTLPPTAGSTTVTASATGLSGSPVTFVNNATAPTGSGSTVTVVNNQFQPATLTVPVGTTVSFVWAAGAVVHQIDPEPPATIPSDPAVSSAPHSYSVTFNTPGTYRYYCNVHGDAGTGGIPNGMSGSIVVQ